MIVLTGAAGFVGSNVLRGLNDIGLTDILIVEDLTNGAAARNLAGTRFLDYMDWQDFIATAASLPKLEAVLHFGGNTDTQMRNGRQMMDDNYNVSKTMLSVSARSQCPFVYASSAGVYGNKRECIEEFEHEDPLTPYAVSKWMFDQYVRKYLAADPQHPVIGLRLFNVYGPGEAHKGAMASVAYKAFDHLKRGAAPAIFHGSEAIRRDFVYVRDVVYVTLHFLTKPVNGIFNVGTGTAESFQNLAETASGIVNGPAPIATTFPTQVGYQFFTQADLTKLRAAGYEKQFLTLTEGLQEYYQHSFA